MAWVKICFRQQVVMARSKSFIARVRGTLPNLHPAERRVGELVCDFPGEVASYSAKELASLAGVSNATVTRFVHRLGYDSYEDARRHARQESETGSRLYLTSHARRSDVSAELQLEKGIDNLQRTLSGISPTTVQDVALVLLKARRVWIFGFRASHAFAEYLFWQLTQVVDNIASVPGAGQTLGEHLVAIGPDDVALFFGLRRRIAQNDLILEEIERRGAKLAYVTDEQAPLRPSASWHIRCETASSGPLFNHVSVMAFCHMLASQTIELAGDAGRARLRDIEGLNDALEEL